MNPFFFGSSAEPLYGVYHPPREQREPPIAALLCYPLGIEYMRAHRAFRQLTTLLTRAGVHVLRFDYFGTGDSAGEGDEVSMARCLDDIEVAFDELTANAGVRRAGIIGLRLGGSLAAMAARRLEHLDRLVLWDPIVEGRAYLDELKRFAQLEAHGNGDWSRNGEAWPAGTVGVGGFPLTAAMRQSLATIDLAALAPPRASITLLTSEERESDQRLCRRWTDAGAAIECRCVPSENRWVEGDAFGSALIPQDIIKAVVETFAQEAHR